jgi:hypothetical protein
MLYILGSRPSRPSAPAWLVCAMTWSGESALCGPAVGGAGVAGASSRSAGPPCAPPLQSRSPASTPPWRNPVDTPLVGARYAAVHGSGCPYADSPRVDGDVFLQGVDGRQRLIGAVKEGKTAPITR